MSEVKNFIVFTLLLSFPVFASALDFSFDFGAGVKTARTHEYVYEGDKCISRLDWNDAAVPVVSFSGTLEVFNFFIQSGMTLTVPVQSGTMEDYDFLMEGSNEPSLYSFHDSYLDKDFSCSFALGYRFKTKKWVLSPSAGFSYYNRKWSASGGYLQYPASGLWTGTEPKQNLNGTIIGYEQVLMSPSVSLQAGYALTSRFALFASGNFYPYVWAHSVDSHFLRDAQFYDTMEGGMGYAFELGGAFSPSKNSAMTFCISLQYEAFRNVAGTTASNVIGLTEDANTIDEGYSSKTENSAFRVVLGVRTAVPKIW
jgi:outer membrane protease